MHKNISILGSTGSIGVQTLDVCEKHNIRVHGLAAGCNLNTIEKQILKFSPKVASVATEEGALELKKRLAGKTKTEILFGNDGLKAVSEVSEAEIVVSAIVGIAGMLPTLYAIRSGKDVALANKETLVAGGSVVMAEAKRMNVNIIPVDSEHSAIFQCLYGNEREDVNKIILTASGGPFRTKTYEEMKKVTIADALNHPNWSMGKKVTIDSASMMNKGLEVIEAKWLFNRDPKDIEVLVHPESIVHSMVEYNDHSVIAQLGLPDMRLPILVALSWPGRVASSLKRLNLAEIGKLTFEEPDFDRFRCLKLAFDAIKEGGTMPCAMNAANEVAVSKFLNEEISFLEIPGFVENVMLSHSTITEPTEEQILACDREIRLRGMN